MPKISPHVVIISAEKDLIQGLQNEHRGAPIYLPWIHKNVPDTVTKIFEMNGATQI